MEERWTHLLKRFFSGWLIFGAALLVGAYIVHNDLAPGLTDSPKMFYIVTLCVSIANSFGGALIIASIFNFSIESKGFMDYVNKILMRIVVSKDFLKQLSSEDKKQALELILKPSDKQAHLYSNINDYFNEYIRDSMQLFDTNFKSSLTINTFSSYDEEKKAVRTEGTVTYRIYKTSEKFEPIVVGFDNELSKLVSTEIIAPDGTRDELLDIAGTPKVEESGFKWTEYRHELPEKYGQYSYLNVKRQFIEYGRDHWQYFCYKALNPTDTMNVSMRVDNGMLIKEYMIFDIDKNYSAKFSEDRKSLEIYCNQWLKAGVGFGVIVAKESFHA